MNRLFSIAAFAADFTLELAANHVDAWLRRRYIQPLEARVTELERRMA